MVSKKNSKDGHGTDDFNRCTRSRRLPEPIGAGRIPGLTPVGQQPKTEGTGHMPHYLSPQRLDRN